MPVDLIVIMLLLPFIGVISFICELIRTATSKD